MNIEFRTIDWGSSLSGATNLVSLRKDNWNDFGFVTLFHITVYDENGVEHDLGGVKIGFYGQIGSKSATVLAPQFKRLGDEYFSLGQDSEYYKTISTFSEDLRTQLLTRLNDVVVNSGILEKAKKEQVFNTSLLRGVSLSSVEGQFRKLLGGAYPLTEFRFSYEVSATKKTTGFSLDFNVIPESNPPSNIHVIIGSNGVGKTLLLNNMIKCLIESEESTSSSGKFIAHENSFESKQEDLFAGIVSVAFSAFDSFEPYPEQKDKSEGVRYSYVGLKRSTNRGGKKGTLMSHDMLVNEFFTSLNTCVALGKTDRLILAVEKL